MVACLILVDQTAGSAVTWLVRMLLKVKSMLLGEAAANIVHVGWRLVRQWWRQAQVGRILFDPVVAAKALRSGQRVLPGALVKGHWFRSR